MKIGVTLPGNVTLLRPVEKKKKDIDRAMKENKIGQVAKLLGAPLAVAPSLYY